MEPENCQNCHLNKNGFDYKEVDSTIFCGIYICCDCGYKHPIHKDEIDESISKN